MLRPDFLSDETLGHLPDALVLFYLKLWLLTDDEGYFEWRPGQIAASLYPYRRDTTRLRQVAGWLARLLELDRVKLLECGIHGVIPTIPRHRIKGGSQSSTYRDRHRSECNVRTSPDKSVSVSSPVSGSIRSRGREQKGNETGSDFQSRVGLPAFMDKAGDS